MKKYLFAIIVVVALLRCSSNPSTESSSQLKDTIMKPAITVADYATDPQIETHTKTFLKAFNSGGGKPMEEMAPADARKVLEGAQASATIDLSGIGNC